MPGSVLKQRMVYNLAVQLVLLFLVVVGQLQVLELFELLLFVSLYV